MFVSGTELWTDRQTDDPITRCSWQTFQAGGIKKNKQINFLYLQLRSAWAGYYDYNYVDQNLVIGPHPFHTNFYFASGMSGHGVQQAVAIGNAVSEHILYGHYHTIDLTRFGFDRFVAQKPLKEDFIV